MLVTKYRRKCFTNQILNRLEEIVRKNCSDWEVELIDTIRQYIENQNRPD